MVYFFRIFGRTGVIFIRHAAYGRRPAACRRREAAKNTGKLTGVLPVAVALGAVVTGILQSSSATTVMTVGFVNAGLMNLKQAFGVVMGANIGTTMTAQLLLLSLPITSLCFLLSALPCIFWQNASAANISAR